MKFNQEDFSNLMKRVQEGDEKSYQMLLTEILKMLRVMLSSKIQNTHDREDVIQNILMAIHKARHTYIPTRPFSPWLGSIVKNKVIDYYRYQKKHSITDLMETHTNIEDNKSFIPEDVSEDFYNKILEAIKELPKNQRIVVQMLKIHGLSIKETSLKTGLSESNVKVTAHRAYKRLKKLFLGDANEN